MSVSAVVLFCVAAPYFLWHVIPLALRHGSVVIHYNLYFGIDNVEPWGWALALPGLWLAFLAADIACGFGSFRDDAPLAIGLLIAALFWSMAWVGALLSLAYMNV